MTIFERYFDDFPAETMPVRRFFADIGSQYSDEYCLNIYQYLHAIGTFLKLEELQDENIFSKIRRPRTTKKLRRYFTPEQIISIINACRDDYERCLILVLIDSACRIGDLAVLLNVNIFTDHFDIKGRYIGEQLRGKTGQLTYRLQPELCRVLKTLNPKSAFVFSADGKQPKLDTLKHKVRAIIQRAGITGDKLGAHTIRHYSANLIARETKSALVVKAGALREYEGQAISLLKRITRKVHSANGHSFHSFPSKEEETQVLMRREIK
ncbi:tyrosine-type recombinase/integrase [Chloroflexota bacterium]